MIFKRIKTNERDGSVEIVVWSRSFQKNLQHLVARSGAILAVKLHIDFSKGLPTLVARFAATVTSLQRF
jgi:hypothetical protein